MLARNTKIIVSRSFGVCQGALNSSKRRITVKSRYTTKPSIIRYNNGLQCRIKQNTSQLSIESAQYATMNPALRCSSSLASTSGTSSFDSPSEKKSNPFSEMEDIVKGSDSGFTLDELKDLALRSCTPLSLSDMYKYASGNVNSKNYATQRLRNAQFLHQEMPIRVAQRTVDLLTLPYGLNKTQSVQDIVHIYLKYLQSFKNFPCPTNEDEELKFTSMLRTMVLDRSSIPEAIARGLFALKDHRTEGLDVQRLQAMEKALYRFFNARTGLRLLTEHHVLSCKHFQEENIELRRNQSWVEQHNNTNEYGCIQKNCDPTQEARMVSNQIMEQCKKRYGVSPEIEIIDCSPKQFARSDFTYVPHHLQYMLAELLKNSCRATVKRYMEGKTTQEDHVHQNNLQESVSLPPIRVVVAKGAEDVTIKIADRGGGVPRSVIDKMWTFAHSTLGDNSSERTDTHFEIDEFTGASAKGRGFNIRGFGLPLARIYARYFGGELTLKSMEGYGVDAYLYLPVLGNACENLPKRVQKSPGQGDSVHDGNHHVYFGDSFNIGADEPWTTKTRNFSSESFTKKLSKVAL